jgi:DNA relaxase NicK
MLDSNDRSQHPPARRSAPVSAISFRAAELLFSDSVSVVEVVEVAEVVEVVEVVEVNVGGFSMAVAVRTRRSTCHAGHSV